MNCIDLLLNIATAVGTIGATIVALWLALRDNHMRINSVFIWGIPTDYQPTLLLQNLGDRIAVIDYMEIQYGHKKQNTISLFDEFSMREYAVIPAKDCRKVQIKAELLTFIKPRNSKRRRTLKITVHTLDGRKYVSKQKYSYNKLEELIFGQALFKQS